MDQVDAFAAAALVVCHGGSGTAYGALAAGVPLVVLPSFADHLANGRRIAGAGVIVEAGSGRGPRRLFDDRDIPRITVAIDTVLTQPSYGTVAQRIATEMAAVLLIDDVLADLLAQ